MKACGNMLKWTPRHSLTLSPIKTKTLKNHYVHQYTQHAKTQPSPTTGVPLAEGQHIQLLVFFLIFQFLFCSILGIAHNKNGWADIHQLYVKRRGLTQGSAFWGSHRHHFTLRREIFQNPPNLGLGIGISSLNKTAINFGTVQGILVQCSSIDAA